MSEKPDLTQQLLLELLNGVAGLNAQVSNVQGQNNIIIQEQQRAAEGRKQTYDRLRAVEEGMITVKRIAPLVDKHEQHHQRTVGAVWLGRTLWAALAGAGGGLVMSALHWLTGIRPPHP